MLPKTKYMITVFVLFSLLISQFLFIHSSNIQSPTGYYKIFNQANQDTPVLEIIDDSQPPIDEYQPNLSGMGWMVEGNGEFGKSVSTAGDVNGDGYYDVIIGAPGFSDGQLFEGGAFVYYGSVSGPSMTPDWIAEGNQSAAELGTSVGNAGDIDGDGFDDVVIGAKNFENGEYREGRAYLFRGSADGLLESPSWGFESDQAEAELGYSLGAAGDVNGDGYDDVIVGAHWYDNGQVNEGRVFVFYGSSAGLSSAPDWFSEGDQAYAYYGESVGTAGDVNGDGFDDVIIGISCLNNGGQACEGGAVVFHGSSSGLMQTPSWMVESNQESANLGVSVATAGDVNGDGYDDVIIGSPGYDNEQIQEGRAFVYLGSSDGLNVIPAWIGEIDVESGNYGISVNTAGDLNADGYDDVIVGTLHTNQVYAYYGGETGISQTPTWISTEMDEGIFGYSVKTALDVNGDGFDEVIVGAPSFKAFLYYLAPPVANAGEDQVVNTLTEVTLDGSGSYNRFGSGPLSYTWEQTSGIPVLISDPTSINPTFLSPDDPTDLTFTLVVTDTEGLVSEADDVMIEVLNQEPVSDAGPDQLVDTRSTVTLSGSGTDPDNDLPLSFAWTQTGGPGVTLDDPQSGTPSFLAPSIPCVLTFTLSVTDALGMADATPDEVVVLVVRYNLYLPAVLRAPLPPTTIFNGDFENGRDGSWTEYSELGYEIIVQLADPLYAHSGDWAAWLGGDNDEISLISQDGIYLTGVRYLHFWFWIDSEDICGYDFGYVFVNDQAYEIELCSANNTGGWVEGVIDLQDYLGTTITLEYGAITDEINISSLLIDDVSLSNSVGAGSFLIPVADSKESWMPTLVR